MVALLAVVHPLGGPDYAAMVPPPVLVVKDTPAIVWFDDEPVPYALDLYDWQRLAQCESAGDWHIATGNGFSGGVQDHPATWASNGGLEYAPAAHLATVAEQIEVNRRVLDTQGPRAWPICGRLIGWTT